MKKWNAGRCRGLNEAKKRVGDLEGYARKLLKTKNKIKILEFGCGYGRVLLELRKVFGDRVETYGVNLEKDWGVNIVKDFGIKEKIFDKKEIDKNLPKVYIFDAGKKMPLKSDSFDLIFSQASVQYIGDKALFLEEVNRILTKEGIAIIEMQEIKRSHPLEYRNLFEIWDKGGKLIPFRIYARKFKNIQVKKSKDRPEWTVVIMKKAANFDLGLKLMNCFGFDINEICDKWRGDKSVYGVRK